MKGVIILLLFFLVLPMMGQDSINIAASYFGLKFTPSERDSLNKSLDRYRNYYQDIRRVELENAIGPAFYFNPYQEFQNTQISERYPKWEIEDVDLPADRSLLAYYSISQLAGLLKNRKISAEELAIFFLERLHRYNDSLQCVVSFMDSTAIAMARQVDHEIKEGKYKGILHGIPFGAKDLLAYPGYPTTWGAAPFRSQSFENKAFVIQKLEEAGSICIAKLTLGALAMGDVWFGGVTKNPWDLSQGSSGSSAGSASASVAGLLPYAIGSETLGSIVSPSNRCGATGLRPTYGRVSRSGAMTLSWSMDKLGPICRSAEDCAIVLSFMCAKDDKDPYQIAASWNEEIEEDPRAFKIAYLNSMIEDPSYPEHREIIELLQENGFEIEPIKLDLKVPVSPLRIILGAEAAAAFDAFSRLGLDDSLTRQDLNAWPNFFRQSRFIPATEYIQANRIRTLLIREFNSLIHEYDAVIAPSFGELLLITNLTGHPQLVFPCGFDEDKHPISVSIIGKLLGEEKITALGKWIQQKRPWHLTHPPGF